MFAGKLVLEGNSGTEVAFGGNGGLEKRLENPRVGPRAFLPAEAFGREKGAEKKRKPCMVWTGWGLENPRAFSGPASGVLGLA